MDKDVKYNWVAFYEEFAQKLLGYKTKRKDLILVIEKVYKETGIKLPKLVIDNKIVDIDPFTVFGLFNKRITDDNRRIILESFSKQLDIKNATPRSFEGIPLLDNKNATFYYFKDKRKNEDINNLWDFFESALNYSNNPTDNNKNKLSHYFDIVINMKGIGNGKITMGLYWIAPKTYLSIEKTNENFIYNSGNFYTEFIRTLPQISGKISAKDYFDLIDKMKSYLNSPDTNIKSFCELSYEASKFSEQNKKDAKKEGNSSRILREEFISWLKSNGVSQAAIQYENGLRSLERYFEINIDEEFERDKCSNLLNKIKTIKTQANGNQNNWKSYLKKYIEFKKELVANGQRELNKEVVSYLHNNTIFYGVPGCGKSYYVKNLLRDTQNKFIDEKFYKRILFHPEYTHSDFVGQIMPESNADGIAYKFRAGPFVRILRDALLDENNQYFLIIEEINRGNAPAIFGEIFQLLDRENGESEYRIDDKEIINWLDDNDVKNISKLYIPKNLTIFATMNTSDQNVFTIDTAFKRRWRMHRIENDFNNSEDAILGKKIDKLNFPWKQFAKAINEDILGLGDCGITAEDKLLGTHFVKTHELEDINQFAEKICMYLWNDVVKYNREQLFKPTYKLLDQVIKDFINGQNVFSDNCKNVKNLYEELEKINLADKELLTSGNNNE